MSEPTSTPMPHGHHDNTSDNHPTTTAAPTPAGDDTTGPPPSADLDTLPNRRARDGARFADTAAVRRHFLDLAQRPGANTAALRALAGDPELQITPTGNFVTIPHVTSRRWILILTGVGGPLDVGDFTTREEADAADQYIAKHVLNGHIMPGEFMQPIDFSDPSIAGWFESWRSTRGEDAAQAIHRAVRDFRATQTTDQPPASTQRQARFTTLKQVRDNWSRTAVGLRASGTEIDQRRARDLESLAKEQRLKLVGDGQFVTCRVDDEDWYLYATGSGRQMPWWFDRQRDAAAFAEHVVGRLRDADDIPLDFSDPEFTDWVTWRSAKGRDYDQEWTAARALWDRDHPPKVSVASFRLAETLRRPPFGEDKAPQQPPPAPAAAQAENTPAPVASAPAPAAAEAEDDRTAADQADAPVTSSAGEQNQPPEPPVDGRPAGVPADAEPVEGVDGYWTTWSSRVITVYAPDGTEAGHVTDSYNDSHAIVDDVRIPVAGHLTDAAQIIARHHLATHEPDQADRVRAAWTTYKGKVIIAFRGTIRDNPQDDRAAGELNWSPKNNARITGTRWNPETRNRKAASILAAFARLGRNIRVVDENATSRDDAAKQYDPEAKRPRDKLVSEASTPAETSSAQPTEPPSSEPELVVGREGLTDQQLAGELERLNGERAGVSFNSPRHRALSDQITLLTEERDQRDIAAIEGLPDPSELSDEDIAAEQEAMHGMRGLPRPAVGAARRARATLLAEEQGRRITAELEARPQAALLTDEELNTEGAQLAKDRFSNALAGAREARNARGEAVGREIAERRLRTLRERAEQAPIGQLDDAGLTAEIGALSSQRLHYSNFAGSHEQVQRVEKAHSTRLVELQGELQERDEEAFKALLEADGRIRFTKPASSENLDIRIHGRRYGALHVGWQARLWRGQLLTHEELWKTEALRWLIAQYEKDPQTLDTRTWGAIVDVELPPSFVDRLTAHFSNLTLPEEAQKYLIHRLDNSMRTQSWDESGKKIMVHALDLPERTLPVLERMARRLAAHLDHELDSDDRKTKERAKRARPHVLRAMDDLGDWMEARGLKPLSLDNANAGVPKNGEIDSERVRDDSSPALGDVPATGTVPDGGPGGVLPGPGDDGTATDRGADHGADGRSDAGEGPPTPSGQAEGSPTDGTGTSSEGDRVSGAGGGQPGHGTALRVTGYRIASEEANEQAAHAVFRPASQDDLAPEGKRAKAAANLEAVRVLKRVQDSEQTVATAAEQQVLARWSGWGSVPEIFTERPRQDDPAFGPGGEHEGGYAAAAARWESFTDVRDPLRGLLDDDEWRAAAASTLSAHYTPPEITSALWQALGDLGFDGGEVLEPGSGAGVTFGTAPASARLTGVEIDPTSAAISRLLAPGVRVLNESFADTVAPDGAFDAVVGNVPFARVTLYDPKHNRGRHRIHNHFVIKSVALTRPGGIIALIASGYVMDSESDAARAELFEMADLLGAVRLPRQVFARSAGTNVFADILILRRRAEGEEPLDRTWLNVQRRQLGEYQLPVNDYFIDHPERVLGTLTSRMGRVRPEVAVTGDPDVGAPLRTALRQITDATVLTRRWYQPHPDGPHRPHLRLRPAADLQDFTGRLSADADGKLWQSAGDGEQAAVELPTEQHAQLTALIELKDLVRGLNELDRHGSDAVLANAQRRLTKQSYQRYTDTYGPLSLPKQQQNVTTKTDNGDRVVGLTAWGHFLNDPQAYEVLALELWDTETEAVQVSEILDHAPAVRHSVLGQHTDDAQQALDAVIAERGFVDLPHIAWMLQVDENEARRRLARSVFTDPLTGELLYSADYLSGDVRAKLEIARQAGPEFETNVAELERVQPRELLPGQFTVSLGASWLPDDLVQQFFREYLGDAHLAIQHSGGGHWHILKGRGLSEQDEIKHSAGGLAPLALLNRILNGGSMTGRSSDDEEAARAVRVKADQWRDAFQTWALNDAMRADRLAQVYNHAMNNRAVRDFTGSRPSLAGLDPEFHPYDHQLAAAARMAHQRCLVLAHEVGAGKTAALTIGMMAMKNTGQIDKPMVAVPNYLVGQWEKTVRRLFPTARVLTLTSAELADGKRDRVLQYLRANSFDLIIMSHSLFDTIPLSPDFYEFYNDEELRRLEAQIRHESKRDGKSISLKKLQERRQQHEEDLKARAAARRAPGQVYLDDLGLDFFAIDEAHEYKNLAVRSKIPGARVKGSAKAQHLHAVLEWARRNKPDGPIGCLATGTPLSNAIGELHSLLLQADPELLRDIGCLEFDAFATMFGRMVERMEMTIDGKGFRSVERFASFHSVRSLIRQLWHPAVDFKDAEDLGLELPAMKGGQPELMLVPATADQLQRMQELGQRYEAVHRGDVDKRTDNPLAINNDARIIALDPRLIDAEAEPGNKLTALADRIIARYHETKNNRYTYSTQDPRLHPVPGALQFVFLNNGTPGGKNRGNFNAYQELKNLLITRGMPADKIAFAQDAQRTDQRLKLQDQANHGGINVLIGSTHTLGKGWNGQNRAVSTYHVDPDHRPSDMKQKDGRQRRPGNQNPIVEHVWVATEGTFDSRMYGTLATKAAGFDGLYKARLDGTTDEVLEVDDVTLPYEEAMAIISGNPYLIAQGDLRKELRRLTLDQNNRATQRSIVFRKIHPLHQEIERLFYDIARRRLALPSLLPVLGNDFQITLGGAKYTKHKDAAKPLVEALTDVAQALPEGRHNTRDIVLGQLGGCALIAVAFRLDHDGPFVRVHLEGLPGSLQRFTLPELAELKGETLLRRLTKAITEAPSKQIEDEGNLKAKRVTRDELLVYYEELRGTVPGLARMRERLRLVDALVAAQAAVNQAGKPTKEEPSALVEKREQAVARRDDLQQQLDGFDADPRWAEETSPGAGEALLDEMRPLNPDYLNPHERETEIAILRAHFAVHGDPDGWVTERLAELEADDEAPTPVEPEPHDDNGQQPTEQRRDHPDRPMERAVTPEQPPTPPEHARKPTDAAELTQQNSATDADGYGTADLYEAFGLPQPERVPPQESPHEEPEPEADEPAGVPEGQMTVEEAIAEAAPSPSDHERAPTDVAASPTPPPATGEQAAGRPASATRQTSDTVEVLASTDGRLRFTLPTLPPPEEIRSEITEAWLNRRAEFAAEVENYNQQATQTPEQRAEHLTTWRHSLKSHKTNPFAPAPELKLTKRANTPGYRPQPFEIGSWVTWQDQKTGHQVTGQVSAPGPSTNTWYVTTDRTGHTGEHHLLTRYGKKKTGYTYSLNGAATDLRPADGPGEQLPLEDLPQVDAVAAQPVTSYVDYVPDNGLARVRDPIPVTVGEMTPRLGRAEVAFDVTADGIPFVVKLDQDDITLASLFVPRIETDGKVIAELAPAESRGEAVYACVNLAREVREIADKPLYARYREYDFAPAPDGLCVRCIHEDDDNDVTALYRIDGGEPECINHIIRRLIPGADHLQQSRVRELALARRIWAARVPPDPATDGAVPADTEQPVQDAAALPADQVTEPPTTSQEPHQVAREVLQGGDRITIVVGKHSFERSSPWGPDVPDHVEISGTVYPDYRDYRRNAALLDAVIRDLEGNELATVEDVFVRTLPDQVIVIPAEHRAELRPEPCLVKQIRLGDVIAEGGRRGELVTELRFGRGRRGSMMGFSTRDVASGEPNGCALLLTDTVLVVPRERRPRHELALLGRHNSHQQARSETQRTYDLDAALTEAVFGVWPEGTGPQGEIRDLNTAIGEIDPSGKGADAYRANAAAMEAAQAAAGALFDAIDDDTLSRYIGEPLHRLRQHLDVQSQRLYADAAYLHERKQEREAAAARQLVTEGAQPTEAGDEEQTTKAEHSARQVPDGEGTPDSTAPQPQTPSGEQVDTATPRQGPDSDNSPGTEGAPPAAENTHEAPAGDEEAPSAMAPARNDAAGPRAASDGKGERRVEHPAQPVPDNQDKDRTRAAALAQRIQKLRDGMETFDADLRAIDDLLADAQAAMTAETGPAASRFRESRRPVIDAARRIIKNESARRPENLWDLPAGESGAGLDSDELALRVKELGRIRDRAEEESKKFLVGILTLDDILAETCWRVDEFLAQQPDADTGGITALKGLAEDALQMLREALARQSVTRMNPVGSEVNVAEAKVIKAEKGFGLPGGTVLMEAITGFRIGERVLRLAEVIVQADTRPSESTPEPTLAAGDSVTPRQPVEPSDIRRVPKTSPADMSSEKLGEEIDNLDERIELIGDSTDPVDLAYRFRLEQRLFELQELERRRWRPEPQYDEHGKEVPRSRASVIHDRLDGYGLNYAETEGLTHRVEDLPPAKEGSYSDEEWKRIDAAAAAREDFPPTDEQRVTIEGAARRRLNMAVLALAGTGKSTLLKMLSHRMPDRNIVYLAFTKSVAAEAREAQARGEYADNMVALTANAYAARATDRRLNDRLPGNKERDFKKLKPQQVADRMRWYATVPAGNRDLSPAAAAAVASNALAQWAKSADAELGPQHVHGKTEQERRDLFTAIKPLADRVWANLTDPEAGDPDRDLPMDFDYIVKQWALGGYRLDADTLFWDEAQDVNPVLEGVVRGAIEQGIHVVAVGDSNQAIYGFRGASDALSKIPVDARATLTQSFRFGPAVADSGNRFLRLLGTKMRLKGFDAKQSRIEELHPGDESMIIALTNAGVALAAVQAITAGRTVAVAGGVKDLQEFVQAARALAAGEQTSHSELARFNGMPYDDILKEVNAAPDLQQLASLFNLLKKHPEEVDALLESGSRPATTELTADRVWVHLDWNAPSAQDLKAWLGSKKNGVGKLLYHPDTRRYYYEPGKREVPWSAPNGRSGVHKIDNKLSLEEAQQRIDAYLAKLYPEPTAEDGRGRVVPEGEPYDVLVTTTHKAKGLESKRVRIAGDFKGPERDGDGRIIWETMPDDEALRVAYVALTRATEVLDPGGLGWVFEATKGDDPTQPPTGEYRRDFHLSDFTVGDTILFQDEDGTPKTGVVARITPPTLTVLSEGDEPGIAATRQEISQLQVVLRNGEIPPLLPVASDEELDQAIADGRYGPRQPVAEPGRAAENSASETATPHESNAAAPSSPNASESDAGPSSDEDAAQREAGPPPATSAETESSYTTATDQRTTADGESSTETATADHDLGDEEQEQRQREVEAIADEVDFAERAQRAMSDEHDQRLVDLLGAYREGSGDPVQILQAIADVLEEFAAEVESTERGTGRGRLGAGWARKARDRARQALSRHERRGHAAPAATEQESAAGTRRDSDLEESRKATDESAVAGDGVPTAEASAATGDQSAGQPAQPEAMDQPATSSTPPADDGNGILLPVVRDEFSILFAASKGLLSSRHPSDGTPDHSVVHLRAQDSAGVLAEPDVVRHLIDQRALRLSSSGALALTETGRQRLGRTNLSARPEPAAGDRVLLDGTGHVGVVCGYRTSQGIRYAEVVADRNGWPQGWDTTVYPRYLTILERGVMGQEQAAELYRVAARREQAPDTEPAPDPVEGEGSPAAQASLFDVPPADAVDTKPVPMPDAKTDSGREGTQAKSESDPNDAAQREFGGSPTGEREVTSAAQTAPAPVGSANGDQAPAESASSAQHEGAEELDQLGRMAAVLDVVARALKSAKDADKKAVKAAQRASEGNQKSRDESMIAAYQHLQEAERHEANAQAAHAAGDESSLMSHARHLVRAAMETQEAAGVPTTATSLFDVLDELRPAAERAAREELEERLRTERDRELTAVMRMDEANRDRLLEHRYLAERAVAELGWWTTLVSDMAHAYQGRLWLDEQGKPRLLRRTAEGRTELGRTVSAPRVQLLRTHGFLAKQGTDKAGFLRPTAMGEQALYLATLYPDDVHKDEATAYQARFDKATKSWMNNEEKKEAARSLPALRTYRSVSAEERPEFLESSEIPQISAEDAARHAKKAELAGRFAYWMAMTNSEHRNAPAPSPGPAPRPAETAGTAPQPHPEGRDAQERGKAPGGSGADERAVEARGDGGDTREASQPPSSTAEQSPAPSNTLGDTTSGILLPIVSDEYAILYAASHELMAADQTPDGRRDTRRITLGRNDDQDGVLADTDVVERLVQEQLLEYRALMELYITPAGQQRLAELHSTERTAPAVGDRALILATGMVGIVCGYHTNDAGARYADVVCPSQDWPDGWDTNVGADFLTTIEPAVMDPQDAAELYRVAALRQVPGTLTDPDLRALALENLTAAAIQAPRVAHAARTHDIFAFAEALASWAYQWATEQWAEAPRDGWPDWVGAYLRDDDAAEPDRNGLYVELALSLHEQLRTTEPTDTAGHAATPAVQGTAREERPPTAEPARLPELNVTPPNREQVPQLDTATPFADDADAQLDVERLEGAFSRWSQQPTVQEYLRQDDRARPNGQGTPDNPIAALRAAYEQATVALSENTLGGLDDLLQRLQTVAAWCQALEPAVDVDLRATLQQLHTAVRRLAARSQATIEALATAPTEGASPPASTPKASPEEDEAAARPGAPTVDRRNGAASTREQADHGRYLTPEQLADDPEARGFVSPEIEKALFGSNSKERIAHLAGQVTAVFRGDGLSQGRWYLGRYVGSVQADGPKGRHWRAHLPFGTARKAPLFAKREAALAYLALASEAHDQYRDLSRISPEQQRAFDFLKLAQGQKAYEAIAAALGPANETALQALANLTQALSNGHSPSGNVADDLVHVADEAQQLYEHAPYAAQSEDEFHQTMGSLIRRASTFLDTLRPDDPRANHHAAQRNLNALEYLRNRTTGDATATADTVAADALHNGDLVELSGHQLNPWGSKQGKTRGYVIGEPARATVDTGRGTQGDGWLVTLSEEPFGPPGFQSGRVVFAVPATNRRIKRFARATETGLPTHEIIHRKVRERDPGRPEQRSLFAPPANLQTSAAPTHGAADQQPPVANTGQSTAPAQGPRDRDATGHPDATPPSSSPAAQPAEQPKPGTPQADENPSDAPQPEPSEATDSTTPANETAPSNAPAAGGADTRSGGHPSMGTTQPEKPESTETAANSPLPRPDEAASARPADKHAVQIEELPEARPYTERIPLATDPYVLYLSGHDGQGPHSGEIHHGDTLVATVERTAANQWLSRTAGDNHFSDSTQECATPHEAAHHGAIIHSVLTDTPYGKRPTAAPGATVDDRAEALRTEVRDTATRHQLAISHAAATTSPEVEQHPRYKELVARIGQMARTVADNHTSAQMAALFRETAETADAWLGALPTGPAADGRRALVSPLAHLRHDLTALQGRLQATLDAARAEQTTVPARPAASTRPDHNQRTPRSTDEPKRSTASPSPSARPSPPAPTAPTSPQPAASSPKPAPPSAQPPKEVPPTQPSVSAQTTPAAPPASTPRDTMATNNNPHEPPRAEPLATDPAYQLHLSDPDSRGEVLHNSRPVADVYRTQSGDWIARMKGNAESADTTPFTSTPQEAAHQAAVLFSMKTGTPYGAKPTAAPGDGNAEQEAFLRTALRETAAKHKKILATAVDQSPRGPAGYRQMELQLRRFDDAEKDAHDLSTMSATLSAVQQAVTGVLGRLPNIDLDETRQVMLYPLTELLYDLTQLRGRLNATIDAASDKPSVTRERDLDQPKESAAAQPAARSADTATTASAPPSPSNPLTPPEPQPTTTPAAPPGPETTDITTPDTPVDPGQPEDAPSESSPEPRKQLPLWAGSRTWAEMDADSASTPVDFETLVKGLQEAFDELVAAGHADELRSAAQAVVDALDRRPVAPKTSPPAGTQSASTTRPPTTAATATSNSQPTRAGAATQPSDQANQAAAVNKALQQADAHGAALADLPEWQQIQTIRGAFGNLGRVLRNRAGERFTRLMADGRVARFMRRASIATCEAIARLAQRGADRLRRVDERRPLPSADALLHLGDKAFAYSAPPRPRRSARAAARAPLAEGELDVTQLRKMGAALKRPSPRGPASSRTGPPNSKPGTGVSAAAARGRSTTTRRTPKGPGDGIPEQAKHLRRDAKEMGRARRR